MDGGNRIPYNIASGSISINRHWDRPLNWINQMRINNQAKILLTLHKMTRISDGAGGEVSRKHHNS